MILKYMEAGDSKASDNSVAEIKKSSKRGDLPFVVAMVVTLILAVAVIRGVRRDIKQVESHPKVDVEQVIKLIDEGRLSGHEAEYWEEAKQP